MNEMKDEILEQHPTETVAGGEQEPQVAEEVASEVQEEMKTIETEADEQQKEGSAEADAQQEEESAKAEAQQKEAAHDSPQGFESDAAAPYEDASVSHVQEAEASDTEEQPMDNIQEDTSVSNMQEAEASDTEEQPMESIQEDSKEETTMEDFDIVSLRPGQIVTGKILRVNDDELLVNVGYKSDGVVSINDIMLEEDKPLTEAFHEGEDIEVEVRKVNDGEGNVILSQKNIVKHKAWKMIEEAFHNEKEIIGIGKQVVKGGLLANIKGFTAFVPASQLSLRYVSDLSIFVGQELRLRILETDKRRNRVVASQRAVLEAEEAEKRQKVWETVEEGQQIKGEVKRITNFGAFVDIGGVDGLIHISDLSWGHIKSPKQVVSEGQEVEVVILSVDKENNRISLGYKQNLPHPWDNIEDKFPTGQVFQGKVVRITSFGAFVELEPGVDGLVHISQISDKRVNKVEDVLNTGEMVNVKVLDVKPKDRRISLSIREAVEKQEKPEKKQAPKESPYVKEEMTVTLGDLLKEQKEKEKEDSIGS
ncbi:MAG TPA: 30S ribosomal protein S1 [Clostridiales bacterium]|nr:30S ribosomal protein S1 [Clostridia bacterium]HCS72695.1 30S ribosomal protein S1 [Clostridiales bacterium]